MEAKGGIRKDFMWKIFEPWQMALLIRLGNTDSERLETILNTVWEQYPGLFESLAIAAVDQEELTVSHCAQIMNLEPAEIEQRLLQFRKLGRTFQTPISNAVPLNHAVVVVNEATPAKLANGQIAVWEIVREFRKLGSLERLVDSFPGIPSADIAAALKYAEQNPQEIESQIDLYENMLAKRRTEYPFVK